MSLTSMRGARRPALTILAGCLTLGLSAAGLTPADAAQPMAAPTIVSGTVKDSGGTPVSGLEIVYDNVTCPTNPGDPFDDIFTPDDYYWTQTDSDGDFAFVARVDECYWVTAFDRLGVALEITYNGTTDYEQIIGAPTGIPVGGISGLDFVIDSAVVAGTEPLKVEIPNGQTGSVVYLLEEAAGDWYLVDEQVLGIDLADVADPTIYTPVGGLPNPDTTALFLTTPGQTYAILYTGDTVNYPQLSDGGPLDPATWYPLDESGWDTAKFAAPSAPGVWSKDVVLKAGATVTGKITLGKAKASETTIMPLRYSETLQEWTPELSGQVNANGSFSIGGLTPGQDYTLAVESDDYLTTYLGDVAGNEALENETFRTFQSIGSGGTQGVGTITLNKLSAGVVGSISGILPDAPDDSGSDWTEVQYLNVETGEQNYAELIPGTTNFKLANLDPGVYAIQVLNIDGFEWYPKAGAEGLVEVKSGSKVNLNLKAEDRPWWEWTGTETAIRGKAAVGETVIVDYSDRAKGVKLDENWSLDTKWVKDHKIVGKGNVRTLSATDLGSELYSVTLATSMIGDTWPAWTRASVGGKVGLGSAARPVFVPRLSTATPKVGEAVTVAGATWTPSVNSVSYQWKRNNKPIPGAISATFIPDATDIGQQLSVEITAKAAGRADAHVTVAAQSPVAAGVPVSYTPVLARKANIGKVLTAKAVPAGWKATYQWLRNDKPIKGAISVTYKTKAADAGKAIRVRVTLERFGFDKAVRTSEPTDVLKGAFKVKLKVKGTHKVGKKITVKATLKKARGTVPKKAKKTYQWYRDGKAIKGKSAKKAVYKVTAADVGHKLKVKVKVKATGYSSKTKKSADRRVN